MARPSSVTFVPAAPLRALIVDDDVVDRRAIRRALDEAREWQINADEAETGSRATELATRNQYDVAFLDYRLPDTDGVALLQQLGRAGFQAPVIALTRHGSVDVATRFMMAGAADYVTKDHMTETRLQQTVRNVLWIRDHGGRFGSQAQAAQAVAPTPPSQSGLRVLAALQPQALLERVQASSARLDWSLTSAPTAAAVLKAVAEGGCDAVLLAERLPDADAETVLGELRKRMLQVPVVLVLDPDREEVASRLLLAGASDYMIPQDLSRQRLLTTVLNAVWVHRLAGALQSMVRSDKPGRPEPP